MILIGQQALNYYIKKKTNDPFEIISFGKNKLFCLNGETYKVHSAMEGRNLSLYSHSYDVSTEMTNISMGSIIVAPKPIIKAYDTIHNDISLLNQMENVKLSKFLMNLVTL